MLLMNVFPYIVEKVNLRVPNLSKTKEIIHYVPKLGQIGASNLDKKNVSANELESSSTVTAVRY